MCVVEPNGMDWRPSFGRQLPGSSALRRSQSRRKGRPFLLSSVDSFLCRYHHFVGMLCMGSRPCRLRQALKAFGAAFGL
jgi:hypothetical protein